MATLTPSRKNFRRAAVALAMVAACAAFGCSKKSEAPSQASYATPEEAGQALVAAAKTADPAQLAKVLGPGSDPLYKSGDAAADKAGTDGFVTQFDKMNRWAVMADGSRVLYIGAENYPFPERLKKNAAGRWAFDQQSALDEIAARRVGKNELLAIDAVGAIGTAEEHYAKTGHDGNPPHLYTQLILSTPGKQDGLYWKADDKAKSLSPLGNVEEFAAEAVAAGNGQTPVFDGYTIKILTAQGDKAVGGAKSYIVGGKFTGGFAVLAYPAKYGDTGVMTFEMTRDGIIYQKDLGATTATLAAAIDSYNPDSTWVEAEPNR
jgi:hypothetical protein